MVWIFWICESMIALFIIAFIAMPIAGAPFYPSSLKIVDKVIKLSNLKKTDKIIDIGSGDGRIVYQFAKRGYQVRGIEINPFFVLFSNLLLLITGNFSRGRVYWRNAKKFDYSEYNLVYVYLFPDLVSSLTEKFKKELKPGAKIVSNTFQLRSFVPKKQEEKLFLYEF